MRTRSKTTRIFRIRSVALLAAIAISFTYWAHWSTLTTGCTYLSMKLEHAQADLLRHCACFLFSWRNSVQANPLTVDPPTWTSKTLRSSPTYRRRNFLPSVLLRLTKCLLDDSFLFDHPQSGCWFSSEIDIVFSCVFLVQKMDLQTWRKGVMCLFHIFASGPFQHLVFLQIHRLW